MFDGIYDLFDLNGDGKLDGIEMAFAYTVMFGDEEAKEPDPWGFDESNDDWEE